MTTLIQKHLDRVAAGDPAGAAAVYTGDVEHGVGATGSCMGAQDRGRSAHFRKLYVWDFRDGKVSSENVWLDGGAIAAQLTS